MSLNVDYERLAAMMRASACTMETVKGVMQASQQAREDGLFSSSANVVIPQIENRLGDAR